jgi:hypothetical protein
MCSSASSASSSSGRCRSRSNGAGTRETSATSKRTLQTSSPSIARGWHSVLVEEGGDLFGSCRTSLSAPSLPYSTQGVAADRDLALKDVNGLRRSPRCRFRWLASDHHSRDDVRLALLNVKKELERELETRVLNCSKYGHLSLDWARRAGRAPRQHQGNGGRPGGPTRLLQVDTEQASDSQLRRSSTRLLYDLRTGMAAMSRMMRRESCRQTCG